jgi:hypothetical protein
MADLWIELRDTFALDDMRTWWLLLATTLLASVATAGWTRALRRIFDGDGDDETETDGEGPEREVSG